MEAQQHALLACKAERDKRVRTAIGALRQLTVGIASPVVDEGDFAGAPGRKIALDEIVRGVVVAGNRDPRRTRTVLGRAERRHSLPLPLIGTATRPLERGSSALGEFDRAPRQQI